MVPHGWMIEAINSVGITNTIVSLFENSKETWRTQLITCNESFGEVYIRRIIFERDSFSPVLFVVVFIPFYTFLYLSIILNETDLAYVTSLNQKLNYLLFMEI